MFRMFQVEIVLLTRVLFFRGDALNAKNQVQDRVKDCIVNSLNKEGITDKGPSFSNRP